MTIVTIQTERDGKLFGQRFLQSAKGHMIRLNKYAVAHLVKHRLQMAELANKECTPTNVVEALFSPATFSY